MPPGRKSRNNLKRSQPAYGLDGSLKSRIFTFTIIVLLVVFLFQVNIPLTKYIAYIVLACGVMYIAVTCWWAFYVTTGKLKHRDALLNMVDWNGKKTVLDIGTGRGLLLIGAAKKVEAGSCIGIDIWWEHDMFNNTKEQTIENAKLENVIEKVEIRNEDIRCTSFSSDYFDVILSNLCLHNIKKKEERKEACNEIVRILKKGGIVVISDGFHTKEYKSFFKEQGLSTHLIKAKFPPHDLWLHTVVAVKNQEKES